MSSLSNERKSQLLIDTEGAAKAFVEDLEHIRETLARRITSRGELRRLSGVLRRLLVEGDITKIASPRFGRRMNFNVPDRKPYYDGVKKVKQCLFFSCGGATVFGCRFEAIALWNAGQMPTPPSMDQLPISDAAAVMRFIKLPLHNFLEQRVLCYHGNWANRREVIKHVAIFGSGVHSEPPVKEEDKLIASMRGSCIYRIRDGALRVHVMPELGDNGPEFTMNFAEGSPPIDFEASDVDVALVEVLAAADLFANSPDVLKLEQIVLSEFSAEKRLLP